MYEIEPLLCEATVSIDADLRGDEDAQVKFFDHFDGPALQLSGNGIDVILRLDFEQLQKIADQIAEWGVLPADKALECLDEKYNQKKEKLTEVRSLLDFGSDK